MRIKSQSSTWAGIMTAVGTITLVFMGTYLYLMWSDGRATWPVYLVTAPFFAMGSLLGYLGLRGLLRLLRFGHWHLDVPDSGGVLGEPPRVTLLPSRDVTPEGEIECELRCLSVKVVNFGKTQRMDTKTLWESSWRVTSSTILREAGLKLSLKVPAAGETTPQASAEGGTVKWQFTVRIPTLGMSDEPVFDVPILHR